MTKIDRAYLDISDATVLRAVDDWRDLCNGRKIPENEQLKGGVSFDELREFFRSKWCRVLCGSVDPLYVLAKLERERITARVCGRLDETQRNALVGTPRCVQAVLWPSTCI
jgi:hypothetical protein